METAPDGYRRNAGICLINPSKKIFAASRLDNHFWQMPQGGIGENEDPKDAAVRELREETGITSAEFLAEVYHIGCHMITIQKYRKNERIKGNQPGKVKHKSA
ncbi:unnamed protein product [Camellia sinensis]